MRTLIIILAIVGVIAGGGWYYQKTHPDIVSVQTAMVKRGTVESTVSNTRAGTVKACRRAKLSLTMGGQITQLPHPEGSLVHRGDLLLAIDPADVEAEIKHIRAQILSTQDHARATCLRADYMTRSAERTHRLHEGTISLDKHDKVTTEAQIAREECKAARSAVTVAEASLGVAQERLRHTRLLAPFDGRIAKINGQLGEYVAPAPPVIDLIAPGCFTVTVPIDEVDAARIAPGMKAHITLDAWRDRTFDATVTRVGRYVIDRQKQARTVDVELAFSDHNLTTPLLAGYSADATIVTAAHADTLKIPTQALLDEDHVLLFDPASERLVKRTVTKGLENWRTTEITGGLKAGDRVVLSPGSEGVVEGALATIAKEPSP